MSIAAVPVSDNRDSPIVGWVLSRLVVSSVLVLLASCTVTVSGQNAAPSSTSSVAPPVADDPARLGFRKVQVTEPSPVPPGPAPTTAPDPAQIDAAKAARQRLDVRDPAAVRAAIEALDCAAPDPLRGYDDLDLPLITCDRTSPAKYALEPAFLDGSDVASAKANIDLSSGRWNVELTFSSAGTTAWADFTAQNIGQQVAIVVNTEVVSAPTIEQAILSGDTIISGNFTREEAERLAASLTPR
jgi:preprotein translocase subunit SecD